jgi:hypothetical protein
LKDVGDAENLDLLKLWDILQKLLLPIWPSDRTVIDGVTIGDAWPLSTLKRRLPERSSEKTFGIQPFHKLTQWITYSLLVPFERVLGKKWSNAESLTCLAEYRNGGLYVDLGALSLKPDALERGLKASGGPLPVFKDSDDVVVEWRAITLALMDVIYPMVKERMPSGVGLSMAQLLGPGTWMAGRALAAEKRPETRSSPIIVDTDGTLF